MRQSGLCNAKEIRYCWEGGFFFLLIILFVCDGDLDLER